MTNVMRLSLIQLMSMSPLASLTCFFSMLRLYSELYYVDVLHLVVSAYVVNLSVASFTHHKVDCLAVVFDVKPVPYVVAFAINGQLLAFEYVVDN